MPTETAKAPGKPRAETLTPQEQLERFHDIVGSPAHGSDPKTEPLATPLSPEERLERDTARYEALAREHGADLGEEGFNEALRKVARRAPDPTTPPKD